MAALGRPQRFDSGAADGRNGRKSGVLAGEREQPGGGRPLLWRADEARDPAFVFRPLLEIAQTLRQRQTSAQELIEAAIARHDAFGDRLHAYSQWAPQKALTSARATDAAFAAGATVARWSS